MKYLNALPKIFLMLRWQSGSDEFRIQSLEFKVQNPKL